MYLVDFTYDNKSLSDFNSIIGYYESSAETTIPLSTPLSLNTVKVGQRFKITSADYEDAYSTTISFVKNPCVSQDIYYSEDEINAVLRWLRKQRKYKKFKPVYDDGSFQNVYLMGIFTEVNALSNGIGIVGFEATLVTDSAYAHLEDVVQYFNFSDTAIGGFVLNVSILNGPDPLQGVYSSYLNDTSMECWYIYPTVEIECYESGTLELHNSMFPSETIIVKNCSAGETITFSGETKQIESSQSTHLRLYNDFNYVFPKIGNTEDETTNTFSSTLKCGMKVTYSPMTFVTIL